jgi:predicted lipoprotein with Yx(FWY)xxD motif
MKVAFLAIAISAAAAFASLAGAAPGRAPAVRYMDDRYGAVLTTPRHQALYTWTAERDLKIHCTGACAHAWPPLYATRNVPTHVAGIKGTFGTIRRPDGRRQLTFNHRPVYTYAHEGPEQILCDNVNGWFVVRLR